ncbi:hypothetical protein BH09SUM1_BH09SUM1_30070 [soil metagenome]
MKELTKEGQYPQPIDVVWAAFTNGEAMAQWLMPNNFPAAPRVGDKFQFRFDPMGPMGGVIECEILELDPPRRMVWCWTGCKSDGKKMSTQRIEWTLTPRDGGTHVRLVQSDTGLMPFVMRFMMAFGWGTMLKRWLPRVAASFEQKDGAIVYRRMSNPPNKGHHRVTTVPDDFHK